MTAQHHHHSGFQPHAAQKFMFAFTAAPNPRYSNFLYRTHSSPATQMKLSHGSYHSSEMYSSYSSTSAAIFAESPIITDRSSSSDCCCGNWAITANKETTNGKLKTIAHFPRVMWKLVHRYLSGWIGIKFKFPPLIFPVQRPPWYIPFGFQETKSENLPATGLGSLTDCHLSTKGPDCTTDAYRNGTSWVSPFVNRLNCDLSRGKELCDVAWWFRAVCNDIRNKTSDIFRISLRRKSGKNTADKGTSEGCFADSWNDRTSNRQNCLLAAAIGPWRSDSYLWSWWSKFLHLEEIVSTKIDSRFRDVFDSLPQNEQINQQKPRKTEIASFSTNAGNHTTCTVLLFLSHKHFWEKMLDRTTNSENPRLKCEKLPHPPRKHVLNRT